LISWSSANHIEKTGEKKKQKEKKGFLIDGK